jgi:hypothetical protein
MKKLSLTLLILVATLTTQASLAPNPSSMGEGSDYTYLTFETTDGTKTSVDVSSLPVTINLDNSTLTIGSQTFALADLSKMYFSKQDETTGISEELRVKSEEFAAATIYDLQGHQVSKDQLRKGVYIVKSNGKTYKIVVK